VKANEAENGRDASVATIEIERRMLVEWRLLIRYDCGGMPQMVAAAIFLLSPGQGTRVCIHRFHQSVFSFQFRTLPSHYFENASFHFYFCGMYLSPCMCTSTGPGTPCFVHP
jgi:hypothetical protein